MIDNIKCCTQVEQGEDREVASIDCKQNVHQYFYHGHLGRTMHHIRRLQVWQKVSDRRHISRTNDNNDQLVLSRKMLWNPSKHAPNH